MSSPLKVAYFGMQCFWGAESKVSELNGVKKTRVGYAGGTMLNPTYYDLDDHIEIFEVTYDEQQVTYKELLDFFFAHHNPCEPLKRQYISAILYVDNEQKVAAENAIAQQKHKHHLNVYGIQTHVAKLDKFWQAEDYHQKYWLRCEKDIFDRLKLSDQEVVDSELACKLNALLAGYKNLELLNQLAVKYKLPKEVVSAVETIVKSGGNPRACH
ncbi:peptide methionine sulfoxide reductase domain-containing protein [Ditylenchus destructor]|uniref:peptide-methionine (S)-S-oxide reductase n=1 Tax=Ditylenchus destructor TaxID=166010 RepID=A0AAD4MJ62_9BILA|nr:peptide methionine sulfoxide reductase domain-containing protein [Ditylenchus destructor]